MMQQYRCSGSCHGTMVGGPCSCGQIFYGHQNTSFSMFFSTPNTAATAHQPYDEADMYSVDCTLSLGTPSTRLSNDSSNHEKSKRRSTNSCVSNFCWDILQQSKHSSSSSHHKSGRGGGANYNSGGETLLSRRCANCDTTSTPLWRNGPKGPKSLCNACGIRFKKEEKRASATATATAGSNGGAPAGAGVYGAQNISSKYGINEFRFNIDGGDDHHHHHHRDSTDTTGIPFFSSWRLNVHEFTI